MERIVNSFVVAIARAHSYFLSLNDANEASFSDKQLHFIVIGLVGMAMLLVIYPLFKLLSRNHVLIIAFIYVFTLVLGMTFAIELWQRISGSGTMEFGDIVFGICGFLLMFIIFAVIREIIMAIWRLISGMVSGEN